jgi:hypothetical protein
MHITALPFRSASCPNGNSAVGWGETDGIVAEARAAGVLGDDRIVRPQSRSFADMAILSYDLDETKSSLAKS